MNIPSSFKNAIVFKIKEVEAKEIEKVVAKDSLKDIEKKNKKSTNLKESTTFQRIGLNGEAYYKIGDFYFFRIREDKKDIPSSVLNEELQIAKEEVEARNGAPLTKKELASLKEDIYNALIPKAFIKTSFTDFCIDVKRNRIILDASSDKKMATIIGLLNEFFTLNFELLEPELDLSSIMTEWVTNCKATDPFKIEDFVSLKDIGSNAITEYKKEMIDDNHSEILINLQKSKTVSELKVNWHERISFKINDKFILKGLKTTDIFKESLEDDLGESVDDKIAYNEASILLFIEDLTEIIDDIVSLKV